MQRNEQRRPMRHARSQAVLVVRPQMTPHHKFLVMGVYLIASAIIAMWMAYLPSLTGSFLTQLNILPQHVAANVIGSLHKVDQRAAASFDERWSALGVMTEPANIGKRAQRIPFGCEGAFSPLVKNGNFATRCIAAGNTSTKLGAASRLPAYG